MLSFRKVFEYTTGSKRNTFIWHPCDRKRNTNESFISEGWSLFWAEDVSLLMDQYQDIEEQQEELRERNRLLQKNYQQETKRRKVEEQNRLLDLIQSQTAGQIELFHALWRKLEKTESKEVYERLLGKIVVVGIYLKRQKKSYVNCFIRKRWKIGKH